MAKGAQRRKTDTGESAEKFSLEFMDGRRVFAGSATARKFKRVGKRASKKAADEV